MKKLYKSEDNKILFGVIGGIGEYSNVDPVVLRLLIVCITLLTAVVPGLIAYFIAGIIVPSKKDSKK